MINQLGKSGDIPIRFHLGWKKRFSMQQFQLALLSTTTSAQSYFHESRLCRASMHYSTIANKERHSCVFWKAQPDSPQRQESAIPQRSDLHWAVGTLASRVMTSKSCTALPTLLQTPMEWRLYNPRWNTRKAIAILATLCKGENSSSRWLFYSFSIHLPLLRWKILPCRSSPD